MTNTSKPPGSRQVPPPSGSPRPASAYARFIPREELQAYSSWTPSAFGSEGQTIEPAAAAAASAPAAPSPETEQLLHAARQSGYHDGYRDGLVALEGFKQSFAQQMAAQIGQLLGSFEDQFDGLEQQMAQALARTATDLARQVVRTELSVNPPLVAAVATDAVNAVLQSARHIRIHVHPHDLPLVAAGSAEALQARGARLLPSATVPRGGCLVESDVGTIDARVSVRWAQAAKLLGQDVPWTDSATPEAAP